MRGAEDGGLSCGINDSVVLKSDYRRLQKNVHARNNSKCW